MRLKFSYLSVIITVCIALTLPACSLTLIPEKLIHNAQYIEKEKSEFDIFGIKNFCRVKYKHYTRNRLENIKNNAPITYDEYEQKAKDIKRIDIKIPEPKYEQDSKIIELPEPNLKVIKYNIPAGTRDINLNSLKDERRVNSIGVVSPDFTKIVYSSIYYYPNHNQTSSEMYLINVNSSDSIKSKLKNAATIQKESEPIIKSGISDLYPTSFRTLVLLDWSSDSKRIAVKEKIGSYTDGIWKTNLLVYDFESNKLITLNNLRDYIINWWRDNYQIDLIDYMWDIYPVGWDANNPDRIIVYGFAYTKNSQPKFLGTWSIDYKNSSPKLLALTKTDFEISTNGLCLRLITY